MSRASIVVALVALCGAILAWRYLPARGAAEHASAGPDAVLAPAPAAAP
jgi:hypothetical protein